MVGQTELIVHHHYLQGSPNFRFYILNNDCSHTHTHKIKLNAVPPSCSLTFQYKFSHFSVFCMLFQYFTRCSIYNVCICKIFLIFQYFQNFASICAQNSVKILANPYTWRLCQKEQKIMKFGTDITSPVAIYFLAVIR